jgi:hypothetical protein
VSVELLHAPNGVGAVVTGGAVVWDLAYEAFAKAAGVRDPTDVTATSLYQDQCLNGVYYTYGLAGARGAVFATYQLPGVKDSAVASARAKLKRDRDVVGRIHNYKIERLVEIECPRWPQPKVNA